jgi:glutaminase
VSFDADLDELLAEVAEVARPAATTGKVADYIPSIGELDPDTFGLAMVEMDGTEHATGSADTPFPIQSISKLFALVLAMRETGASEDRDSPLWQRVGVEPSGDPFNSLVQLEHEQGIPRNPMINAGALVIDDVLIDRCESAHESLLEFLSDLAGERLEFDRSIIDQEGRTGHRNRAMAFLMSSFENIHNPIDDVLDLYVHQCAISMTCRQLARAARFLGNRGIDPATGDQVVAAGLARRAAAIMLTCGVYDDAGEFAFDIGIPCKSGVAGAIVATVPGELGLCVWSPPLDPSGNSSAGRVALHELSERLGLSLF